MTKDRSPISIMFCQIPTSLLVMSLHKQEDSSQHGANSEFAIALPRLSYTHASVLLSLANN